MGTDTGTHRKKLGRSQGTRWKQKKKRISESMGSRTPKEHSSQNQIKRDIGAQEDLKGKPGSLYKSEIGLLDICYGCEV